MAAAARERDACLGGRACAAVFVCLRPMTGRLHCSALRRCTGTRPARPWPMRRLPTRHWVGDGRDGRFGTVGSAVVQRSALLHVARCSACCIAARCVLRGRTLHSGRPNGIGRIIDPSDLPIAFGVGRALCVLAQAAVDGVGLSRCLPSSNLRTVARWMLRAAWSCMSQWRMPRTESVARSSHFSLE